MQAVVLRGFGGPGVIELATMALRRGARPRRRRVGQRDRPQGGRGEHPYAAVIDGVGGDIETRSLRAVAAGGALVTLLPHFSLRRPARGKLRAALRLGPRYEVLSVRPDGLRLAQLVQLAHVGMLRPTVHKEFPLAQAARAHALIEAGDVRGKVVLRVREEG